MSKLETQRALPRRKLYRKLSPIYVDYAEGGGLSLSFKPKRKAKKPKRK